jgi:hypothetical protein
VTCCAFITSAKGRVGRRLPGLAAQADAAETAVEAHREDARGARGLRVERGLQLLQRPPGDDRHRCLRREGDHHRERRALRVRNHLGATIGCTAVDLAVQDHHLAVDAVERAEPEIAVAEQLADRGVAVVAAGQERRDRGYLVGLGGARSLSGGGEENERKRTPDHAAKH